MRYGTAAAVVVAAKEIGRGLAEPAGEREEKATNKCESENP